MMLCSISLWVYIHPFQFTTVTSSAVSSLQLAKKKNCSGAENHKCNLAIFGLSSPKSPIFEMPHPEFPRSNVAKFSGFDPDKYELAEVSPTVGTDESLTPCQPTRLTQRTINKFLRPLTKDLDEVPPRPTINELPDAVIDKMVQKDKAFWVDKPGANAYTLHDAYYNYGMATEKVLPPHQDVLPRSYQYDHDCVRYRRQHACNGLKQTDIIQKPLAAHCRTCKTVTIKENKYEAASDSSQKRWRYYPNFTIALTPEQMRHMMDEVGRPFKNEACNWYYENYPPVKYNCIMRKFSK